MSYSNKSMFCQIFFSTYCRVRSFTLSTFCHSTFRHSTLCLSIFCPFYVLALDILPFDVLSPNLKVTKHRIPKKRRKDNDDSLPKQYIIYYVPNVTQLNTMCEKISGKQFHITAFDILAFDVFSFDILS